VVEVTLVSPASVHFASIPFTEMPAELESGAVSAAVLPEPFASDAEEAQGGVPLTDLDRGATTSFRSRVTWSPSSGRQGVAGYVGAGHGDLH
jgi:hypothetical protein